MKFVSLFGLLVFLGIAFLMSNKRSKIRIRILLWGLGLQLLFASIILGSQEVSFSGMFVFLSLLVLYIFKDKINSNPDKASQVKFASLVIGSVALGAFLFYNLGSFGLLGPILILTIIAIIILPFMKITEYQPYLTTIFLTSGWAYNVTHNIDGKIAFQALSAKVSTFLKLTDLGSAFLFGNLIDPKYFDTFGFQFAFAVLPTILCVTLYAQPEVRKIVVR